MWEDRERVSEPQGMLLWFFCGGMNVDFLSHSSPRFKRNGLVDGGGVMEEWMDGWMDG